MRRAMIYAPSVRLHHNIAYSYSERMVGISCFLVLYVLVIGGPRIGQCCPQVTFDTGSEMNARISFWRIRRASIREIDRTKAEDEMGEDDRVQAVVLVRYGCLGRVS